MGVGRSSPGSAGAGVTPESRGQQAGHGVCDQQVPLREFWSLLGLMQGFILNHP